MAQTHTTSLQEARYKQLRNSYHNHSLPYWKSTVSMLYLGTHTSLYKSLPPVVIPVLEDAILKTRLRLYKNAEDVFNCELSAYSHIPIVAIEHAELLLHQYKCLEVLEVLGRVPEVLSPGNKEDRDVQRLIAIFCAIMKFKTEAIYEPAWEQLKKMKQDWSSKSVDEYTDIQVSMGYFTGKVLFMLIRSPGRVHSKIQPG
jgi:hypothetical protein